MCIQDITKIANGIHPTLLGKPIAKVQPYLCTVIIYQGFQDVLT